jgi:hypothetical protein
MALTEASKLAAAISPPIESGFADQLVSEFVSVERRFVLRDWEPAELDGGQFAEILARIYYHLDSANLNRTKGFDECVSYIEEDQNAHSIQPRHHALHVCRVLRTIYKFRSQRGAVHISPNYGPNQMDARLIIECVRWTFSETLRIFWNGDRETVAKAVREILDFDVPCIGRFEDALLVQRTDLVGEEEILVLLHYAGENGFSRTELGRHARCDSSVVTRSLQKLVSSDFRQIIQLNNNKYRLTDLGAKRVRETLSDRLLIE